MQLHNITLNNLYGACDMHCSEIGKSLQGIIADRFQIFNNYCVHSLRLRHANKYIEATGAEKRILLASCPA
jgi:hypothetical protein